MGDKINFIRALEIAVCFLIGSADNINNFVILVTLTSINTVIWIFMRREYGTTIGKIFKKQSLEILTTLALVYATNIIWKVDAVDLVYIVLFGFIARQMFYLLFLGYRVFRNHELDKNNHITKSIFTKLFASFGDGFDMDIGFKELVKNDTDNEAIKDINKKKSDNSQKNNPYWDTEE